MAEAVFLAGHTICHVAEDTGVPEGGDRLGLKVAFLAVVEGRAVGAVSDLAELNASGVVAEDLEAVLAGGADGVASCVGVGAGDAILDATVGDAAADSLGEVEGVECIVTLAATFCSIVDGDRAGGAGAGGGHHGQVVNYAGGRGEDVGAGADGAGVVGTAGLAVLHIADVALVQVQVEGEAGEAAQALSGDVIAHGGVAV